MAVDRMRPSRSLSQSCFSSRARLQQHIGAGSPACQRGALIEALPERGNAERGANLRHTAYIPDVDPQFQCGGTNRRSGQFAILEPPFDKIAMVTGKAGVVRIKFLREAGVLAHSPQSISVDFNRLA
jgi:hypothetical protein